MEIDYIKIIITLINISLLIAIFYGMYRAIKGFRSFLLRNKEMEKKMDIILSRLDNKAGDTDKM